MNHPNLSIGESSRSPTITGQYLRFTYIRDNPALTVKEHRFLQHLPGDTKIFTYHDDPRLFNLEEAIQRERSDLETTLQSEFIVFKNIQRSEVNRFEGAILGCQDTQVESKTMVVKKPSALKQTFLEKFISLLFGKAREMGVGSELMPKGAPNVWTSERIKGIDGSMGPFARRGDWPTIIFEIGFLGSEQRLIRSMAFWLDESKGSVNMTVSIVIDRSRGGVEITLWERSQSRDPDPDPIIVQRMTLPKVSEDESDVFHIPFDTIMLRPPVEQHREYDFAITRQDLKEPMFNLWGELDFMRRISWARMTGPDRPLPLDGWLRSQLPR